MIMNAVSGSAGYAAIAVESRPASVANEADVTSERESRALDSFVARILATAEDSAASDSYVAGRRRVLRHLEEHGPRPINSLPRSWPVTLDHLRVLVRDLEADGLIERTVAAGRTEYGLTRNGALALAATRRTQLDLVARLLRAAADGHRSTAIPTFRTLRAALGASPAG